MKIKKIIACSDIHIRNFVRQSEYIDQLDKFINLCKKNCENYNKEEVRIVIVGDLLHQKNNISPDLISIVSTFIRQLQEIATVIIIAGNHDLIENNTTRKDAISSIFDTAQFENAYLLDYELGYKSGYIIDNNIIWCVYSIYDDYVSPDIDQAIHDNPDKKIIGLYHGMIIGARLDNGSIVDSGVEGDTFKGCDYVIAGHIHKHQNLQRGNVPITYCGSLIQQDFGETIKNHGFITIDVEDMNVNYIELENNYELVNMEISSIDDIDNDKEVITNYD